MSCNKQMAGDLLIIWVIFILSYTAIQNKIGGNSWKNMFNACYYDNFYNEPESDKVLNAIEQRSR